MNFEGWFDPNETPPPEFEEVIVITENRRVRSAVYAKGHWNTYVPIVLWQPLPNIPRGFVKYMDERNAPVKKEPKAEATKTVKRRAKKK